ncbi:MAG: hypothetical protein ACMUIP_12890 [bacterium]
MHSDKNIKSRTDIAALKGPLHGGANESVIAKLLINNSQEIKSFLSIAEALEDEVISTLGKEKKIFPLKCARRFSLYPVLLDGLHG